MRLLHTSDLHLGSARFGGPDKRRKVMAGILERFVSEASARKVDLAIIAGDLFDTRKPHPRDWAMATEFITSLAQVCPVVITDGNHDGKSIIRDEDSATLLSLFHTGWGNTVYVGLKPDIFLVGKAVICVTPYPHKRTLDDDPSLQSLTPLQRMEEISKRMDDGLRALHAKARQMAGERGWPTILVAHLTAAGAIVGGERGMRLEDDITISTDVLDLFDYAALGHIHKQQQVSDKAWYSGSPAYASWNEAGESKGFLDVQVEPADVSFNGSVKVVHSGEGEMYDIDSGKFAASVSEAYVRIHEVQGGPKADPEYFYANGARYVEVVRPTREKSVPTSERALAVGTSPLVAVSGWLAENRPALSVDDMQPYLNAAIELMEAK